MDEIEARIRCLELAAKTLTPNHRLAPEGQVDALIGSAERLMKYVKPKMGRPAKS